MRRTAEMVLGLIGSSIGTIIYLMVFITIAIKPPIDYLFTIGVFIMLLLQVIALVLSCLVNKCIWHLHNSDRGSNFHIFFRKCIYISRHSYPLYCCWSNCVFQIKTINLMITI